MNVARLPRPRRNARVPLRIGDVWVLIGPTTYVSIVDLQPRPTFQKPHAHAVTLDDGRTIVEATLRGAYMRLQEYEDVFLPRLREKLRAAFNEDHDRRAEVIQFPKRPG